MKLSEDFKNLIEYSIFSFLWLVLFSSSLYALFFFTVYDDGEDEEDYGEEYVHYYAVPHYVFKDKYLNNINSQQSKSTDHLSPNPKVGNKVESNVFKDKSLIRITKQQMINNIQLKSNTRLGNKVDPHVSKAKPLRNSSGSQIKNNNQSKPNPKLGNKIIFHK